MRITLLGGSGFLGKHLISALSASGHSITLITRRPQTVRQTVPPAVEVQRRSTPEALASIINESDAVVNLTGESIGAKRWSRKRKQEILSSRVETTRNVVEAIGRTSKKPSVLLNASAVGYYGNVQSGDVSERHPPGTDFLADVCVQWEAEARKAERFGVRVLLPRSGVVLANDAEALQRMMVPFKFFVGGPLGSGAQWFPWIHIDDEIGAMVHLLGNPTATGPYNFVAPESVTMRQFCSVLGKAMHKLSWAPVPSFVLKIVLGEMAEALVLGGQKAVPQKLMESGYQFRYSGIREALAQIFPKG